MGLARFREEGLEPGHLRILFKPSLSPEVCVTLAANGPRMQVVALREVLSQRPFPAPSVTFREEVGLEREVADELRELFQIAALAHCREEGRMVVICDGMAISGLLTTSDGSIDFHDHPYRPESKTFVSALIRVAWEACEDPGARNSLALCGRYVSMNLPLEELPVSHPQFNVAVIGVEGDRSAVMGQIEKRNNR